jgi:large subunit ribosomal protein L13
MTTYSAKPFEIERKWYVIDATDLVLGRMASRAATILRGKHKPTFTPSMDCGDHIIIINADKVYLTGNKFDNKKYFWHTGHPGGIKERNVRETMEGKFPERVIGKAIERMISRNPLGREQMRKLHIYTGSEHPHAGQTPITLDFGSENRKNKKSKAA